MEADMAAALITDELYARLLANGARSAAGEDIDPRPVVKLFTPDAGATWLLTEADPEDPDRLFGLCDLGLGEPELGYVSLAEIRSVRGQLRLPVEREPVNGIGRPGATGVGTSGADLSVDRAHGPQLTLWPETRNPTANLESNRESNSSLLARAKRGPGAGAAGRRTP